MPIYSPDAEARINTAIRPEVPCEPQIDVPRSLSSVVVAAEVIISDEEPTDQSVNQPSTKSLPVVAPYILRHGRRERQYRQPPYGAIE